MYTESQNEKTGISFVMKNLAILLQGKGLNGLQKNISEDSFFISSRNPKDFISNEMSVKHL